MPTPFTPEERRLIADAIAQGRVRKIAWDDINWDGLPKQLNLGVGYAFYLARARYLKSQGLDAMTSSLDDIMAALNAGGYRTSKGLLYNYWTAQALRDYLKSH